jgi:hypothetical protein
MSIKRKLHSLFKWEKPSALAVSWMKNKPGEMTWEQWEKETRAKHPIKYVLMEDVPDYIWSVNHKINHFFYYIKSVTYKKQHLLDLRQPKGSWCEYKYGFCDKVNTIVYANFNILCEFVEKEYNGRHDIFQHIEQLKSPRDKDSFDPTPQINFLEKVLELYDWWKIELPKKSKELEDILMSDIKNNEYFDKENALELEINEKLKEIIDNRLFFWT